MNTKQPQTENSIEQPKSEFKSSFKAWIRAVAFVVIAVFLPEQAAQAMGYDPTTIWNHSYFVNQGKNGFLTYLVADNIKRSLDSLSYKQLNQVQLDKNLVIETAPLKESETIAKVSAPIKGDQSNFFGKIGNALQSGSVSIFRLLTSGLKKDSSPDQSLPTTRQGTASSQKPSLYLTGSVVKQINLWLKDPKTQVDNNCGINALNALFVQSGIKVTREELATRAIMVDFLSGNLREFKGELALSLFALQKTAASFGLKTALVKIPASALNQGDGSVFLTPNSGKIEPSPLFQVVPFITYLLSEHFVLVTRVTEDKVYYKEDKEEANMPKEIFLKGFTGNCLVLADSVSLRGSEATPVSLRGAAGDEAISFLSDQEALQISGKESLTDRYNSLKSYVSNTAKSTISTAKSYVSTARSTYTTASNVYNAVKSVTGISASSIVTRSSIPSNPLSAISVPVTTYNYLASPSTKGNLGKSYGAANTLQTDFALTVPKRAYDFTGWVDTVSGLNSNLGTKLYQSSSLVRSISDAYSGVKGRTESSLKQTYGIGTYNNFIKPSEEFIADNAIITVATLGAGSAAGLAGSTAARLGSVSRIAEPVISRLPQISRYTGSISRYLPNGVNRMLGSTEGSLNIASHIPNLERLSNTAKWAGTKISGGAKWLTKLTSPRLPQVRNAIRTEINIINNAQGLARTYRQVTFIPRMGWKATGYIGNFVNIRPLTTYGSLVGIGMYESYGKDIKRDPYRGEADLLWLGSTWHHFALNDKKSETFKTNLEQKGLTSDIYLFEEGRRKEEENPGLLGQLYAAPYHFGSGLIGFTKFVPSAADKVYSRGRNEGIKAGAQEAFSTGVGVGSFLADYYVATPYNIVSSTINYAFGSQIKGIKIGAFQELLSQNQTLKPWVSDGAVLAPEAKAKDYYPNFGFFIGSAPLMRGPIQKSMHDRSAIKPEKTSTGALSRTHKIIMEKSDATFNFLLVPVNAVAGPMFGALQYSKARGTNLLNGALIRSGFNPKEFGIRPEAKASFGDTVFVTPWKTQVAGGIIGLPLEIPGVKKRAQLYFLPGGILSPLAPDQMAPLRAIAKEYGADYNRLRKAGATPDRILKMQDGKIIPRGPATGIEVTPELKTIASYEKAVTGRLTDRDAKGGNWKAIRELSDAALIQKATENSGVKSQFAKLEISMRGLSGNSQLIKDYLGRVDSSIDVRKIAELDKAYSKIQARNEIFQPIDYALAKSGKEIINRQRDFELAGLKQSIEETKTAQIAEVKAGAEVKKAQWGYTINPTSGNLNKIAKSEVNLARISLPLEIARKINEGKKELNGVTQKIDEVEKQIRLNERNFLRKPDPENSQKRRELSAKKAELMADQTRLSSLVEVEGIKHQLVSLVIAGKFGTKDHNQAAEEFNMKADLSNGVEGILSSQLKHDMLRRFERIKTKGDSSSFNRAWNKINPNSEYNRAIKTLNAIKDIDISKIDGAIKDTKNEILKSAALNDNSRQELARKFYEDGITAETIKAKGFWENWHELGQGLSGINQERMNDGMQKLFKLEVLKLDQKELEGKTNLGFRIDFDEGKKLKADTDERKIFDTLRKLDEKENQGIKYEFQKSVGDLIKGWKWKETFKDQNKVTDSKNEVASILANHLSILKNPDSMNNPEFRGQDNSLKDSRGKTELGIFLALTTFKHSGREDLGLFATPNELERVYKRVLEDYLGGEKISIGEGIDGVKVTIGGADYTFIKITDKDIQSSYLADNLGKLNDIFKDKIILTDISTLQNLNMQKIVPSQGPVEKQLAKRLAEIIYDRAVIIDEIHQVSQSPYHIVGFDGKALAEFLKPAEYEKYVDVAEKIDRKFQELANLEEVTNNKGEPVTTVKGYGNLGDRLIKMEYVDEYKGLTTAGENEFKRLLGDKFVTQAENKDFSIERLLVNSFVRNLSMKEEQEGGFGLKKNESQEDEAHPVHFGKINEKMQWSTPEEAISRWVIGFRMKGVKTKDKDNNIIDIPVGEIISKIKISEESVKVSPISVLANFKSSKTFFSATPFYAETMSDLLGVRYQGNAAKFMAKVKFDLEGKIGKEKVGIGDYGEMIKDGKFKLGADRPNIILPALLAHIPDFLNKVFEAAGGREVFYIEADGTVSKIGQDGQRIGKLESKLDSSGKIIKIKPLERLEKRVNGEDKDEGDRNIVVVFSPSKLTSFSFEVKKAELGQKEAQYTLIIDKDTSATDYWQALRRNRQNLEDFNVIFNGRAGEPLESIWENLVKTENLKKNDALVKAITETHQDAMAGRFVRFAEVFPEKADLAYQLLKAFQSKHAKDADITPDKIRSNAYRQIISGFNSDITFFDDVIKDFSPLFLSKRITESNGKTEHTLKFKLTSAEKRFFEDYLKQDKIFRDRNGLDSSRSTGVDKAKVKSELEAIARFKGIPNLEAARFRDYLAQRYSTKELIRKKVSSPESKEAIVVAQQKIQDALETKNGKTPKELAADIRQDLIERGYTESAVAGVLSQMYPSLKESNWLARRGINANYIWQGVLGFGQAFLFINNQENKEKDWFTKLIEKLNFSLGYGKAIGTIQSFSGEFEPEFKEFLSKYYETDGAKGNMRTALRSSLDKMIAASVRGVWESRKNLEFYKYMKDIAEKNIPKDEISRLDKLLNHQIARTNELNVLKARLGRPNDLDELQVALWAQKFVSPSEEKSRIMGKIMKALGMEEKLKDIVSLVKDNILKEANGKINDAGKKIPELIIVFGDANKKAIEDTVKAQNKYYEDEEINKVQIPVYLDESVKNNLISSLGIFYNQDDPSLGASSRYYSTEFLMEYLVKPLQEKISLDKKTQVFVVPVGRIPLSAREHGIVTNILGEGSAQAKGAFISTHPYTTGWMGGFISTIGKISWDLFGTGFKTSLQRVMNHELGHVHGLGHDAKAAYSVMSSSEKEDGSFWSWKWHFWRKDNTYRKEHLDAVKNDIKEKGTDVSRGVATPANEPGTGTAAEDEDKRDGGMVRGGQANVFINGENVNKQIFDREAVDSYQLAIERLGETSLGINAFNKYGNGTASVNQNFATPLYDHLAKLVSENKIAEAKQAINNLVGFIYRQWGGGIIDTDHKYLLDYGVDGNGEIIWLDPGKASSRKTDFVIDSYRESGDIKGSLLGLSQELYNYYIGLTANFADEFQKRWPEGSPADTDYIFDGGKGTADGGMVETVAKLIAEYRIALPLDEAIAKVRELGYSEELITKAIGYNIGLGSGSSNNPLDRGGNKQDKTGQWPASPVLPLAPASVSGINVVSHSGVAGSSNQALVDSNRPLLPNNDGGAKFIPIIKLKLNGILTSFTSGLAPPAALTKTFISNVASSVANAVRSAVELAEKLSGAQSANSGNGEKGQDAEGASGNNIGKRSIAVKASSIRTEGAAEIAKIRGSLRAFDFLKFKNSLIPALNQFINKLSGVSSWLSSKTVLAYRSTLDLNNAEAIPSLRDGGNVEIGKIVREIGILVEHEVDELKRNRKNGETIAGRYPGEKNRGTRDAIIRKAEDNLKLMRKWGLNRSLTADEVGLDLDDDFSAKMTIYGAISGVNGSREKIGDKQLIMKLDKIIETIKQLSDEDKVELILEVLKGMPLLESAKIIKPLEQHLKEGYLMRLLPEDREKLERILGEHRDYNGNEQILKMLEEIKKGQEEFEVRLDKTEEKIEDVKQEAGAAKQEAGAAKQEAGAAKQEAGAAKQEAMLLGTEITKTKAMALDARRHAVGTGDDCLVGAVKDPNVRKEADRELRIEAGVDESVPYVVKDLYAGMKIIRQAYDKFIEKYRAEGNWKKVETLKQEKLTVVKVKEGNKAIELLSKYSGRISIIVQKSQDLLHVYQVTGYNSETGMISYSEDNGEGHTVGYGEIALDEITKIYGEYVFVLEEGVVNGAGLKANVLTEKEQKAIKNVGGAGVDASSVNNGVTDNTSNTNNGNGSMDSSVGSVAENNAGNTNAGSNNADATGANALANTGIQAAGNDMGHGGSAAGVAASSAAPGDATGTVKIGDVEGLSSVLKISNGLSPPEAIFAELANTFRSLANQLELGLLRRLRLLAMTQGFATAPRNDTDDTNDTTDLRNAIDVLNNSASASENSTKNQKAAINLLNYLIQLGLSDKAVRRDEDDVIAALLKKLMGTIKTRGLNDLHGRYFRAARLIAHRYGLPYSSMVELAAAFMLLNETDAFIQALKEEAYVRAEALKAKEGEIASLTAFARNDGLVVTNEVTVYDLLKNVFDILNNSAARYASDGGLAINAIKIWLGEVRESIRSMVEVAANVFRVISGLSLPGVQRRGSNALPDSRSLPGENNNENAFLPAQDTGSVKDILDELAAERLFGSGRGFIASVRRTLGGISKSEVKEAQSLPISQTNINKSIFSLAPPVNGLITRLASVINQLATGGKNVKSNKNSGNEGNNGRVRQSVQNSPVAGDEAGSSIGDVESKEHVGREAGKLNRFYTRLVNYPAKLGAHLVRGPPAQSAGALTAAAVVFGLSALAHQTVINSIHNTLTQPLALESRGRFCFSGTSLKKNRIVPVISAIIISTLTTTLKGGALCLPLSSKLSGFTTSSTPQAITQPLPQPVSTEVTRLGSSWLKIQAPSMPIMPRQMHGKSLSVRSPTISGIVSAAPAKVFQSIGSIQSILTNSARFSPSSTMSIQPTVAGRFVLALVGAILFVTQPLLTLGILTVAGVSLVEPAIVVPGGLLRNSLLQSKNLKGSPEQLISNGVGQAGLDGGINHKWDYLKNVHDWLPVEKRVWQALSLMLDKYPSILRAKEGQVEAKIIEIRESCGGKERLVVINMITSEIQITENGREVYNDKIYFPPLKFVDIFTDIRTKQEKSDATIETTISGLASELKIPILKIAKNLASIGVKPKELETAFMVLRDKETGVIFTVSSELFHIDLGKDGVKSLGNEGFINDNGNLVDPLSPKYEILEHVHYHPGFGSDISAVDLDLYTEIYLTSNKEFIGIIFSNDSEGSLIADAYIPRYGIRDEDMNKGVIDLLNKRGLLSEEKITKEDYLETLRNFIKEFFLVKRISGFGLRQDGYRVKGDTLVYEREAAQADGGVPEDKFDFNAALTEINKANQENRLYPIKRLIQASRKLTGESIWFNDGRYENIKKGFSEKYDLFKEALEEAGEEGRAYPQETFNIISRGIDSLRVIINAEEIRGLEEKLGHLKKSENVQGTAAAVGTFQDTVMTLKYSLKDFARAKKVREFRNAIRKQYILY
ncbi:MAG: hypothetical protein PHP73_05050, partial [Candidatus Omnitrophica bacterium]|nr:hypothetical protein [Candidatus Omnitrophota bacterium]